MVICRETEKEARDYYDAIVAHVERTPQAGFHRFDSDAHAWRQQADRGTDEARAVGGNIRLVGSPEQIVDQFKALTLAGIDGLQLSFYDFQPDLDFFGERVLPLMRQAGLRH
jgi:FMNH2-dependent dimethyl sulfone monooxygenase